MFDTCPRDFQNLDQGPDGVLKIVFLKYGYILGMDKLRDLKFCIRVKHLKLFHMSPGIFRNLDQGPEEVLKTVFLKYG